jgi:hypothetical protein
MLASANHRTQYIARVTRTLCFAAALLAMAGCDQPTKPRASRPAAEVRIEKSIELPGGQGTAHILVVPTGLMESARCVAVTSSTGSPAVSCLPKDFDIPAADGD